MEYHSGGSLPLLGRPRYCPGANANGGYLCETGHCCGETGCCTYYYELWWFWLLWTVLILFSCCCAYRHRRAKLRVQQQQRQREISLLAYHGASSYPSSMLDLSFLASLKLPSYEEVAAQPSTPPPPYSSVFTTPRYPQPPRAADPHLLTQHDPLLHRPLSDGPSSLSSDNSSSCSCDSCCPSSPCSSSLSAPVTYETDTSHASTPSEAAPLTLDVTMETITAAATCLEVNQSRFASERMVATAAADVSNMAREPHVSDAARPKQTVTVAVVTMATSPASEVETPTETASPIRHQCAGVPSILIFSAEEPAEGPATSPKLPLPLPPATPSPSASAGNSPTDALTRTLASAEVLGVPGPVAHPDVERTSAGPSCTLELAPSDPSQAPPPVPTILTPTPALVLAQSPGFAPSDVPQGPAPESSDLSSLPDTPPKLALVPDVATVIVVTSEVEPVDSEFVPALHGVPDPQSSGSPCPAITVDSAQSPLAAPPAPPLATPALLLDPLAALNQPDKGASPLGHASSLSPSPRATQSPPKQTLFSPCVDVFEAEPSSWEEEEEEERDEEGHDEDEDMEADESQYRHRRLTGDSGIEVCRCRMEDEDEEEDEDSTGGDREKKGGANTDLHDSLDCPARGQISTGEALTLCNSATPACEDGGKVVIVMETV